MTSSTPTHPWCIRERLIPTPEYLQAEQADAKDIAVVVLDEEVTGIQPALLPSLGLLGQLANDGALKGQSFTAVGYGATERTHEPGSGAPVFGEGGTRMYSVSTFSALNEGTCASRRIHPPAMAAPATAVTRAARTSWATRRSSRRSP